MRMYKHVSSDICHVLIESDTETDGQCGGNCGV